MIWHALWSNEQQRMETQKKYVRNNWWWVHVWPSAVEVQWWLDVRQRSWIRARGSGRNSEEFCSVSIKQHHSHWRSLCSSDDALRLLLLLMSCRAFPRNKQEAKVQPSTCYLCPVPASEQYISAWTLGTTAEGSPWRQESQPGPPM